MNNVWFNNNPNTNQLLPGVYCAPNRNLTLSKSFVTVQGGGGVTFVAQRVTLSGNSVTLQPAWNNVLLFATGTADDAISVSGNNNSWTGAMYVSGVNGRVQFSGNDNRASGIVADRIQFSGNDNTLTGLTGAGSTYDVALVE